MFQTCCEKCVETGKNAERYGGPACMNVRCECHTAKTCCHECGHHDNFCIPSCYPTHCHNPTCKCHTSKGENKCICACHDTEWNSPNRHAPVEHDTKCCGKMNGYMSTPTQPESSWEESFKAMWRQLGLHLGYGKNGHFGKIKEFIRTEIEAAESRGRYEEAVRCSEHTKQARLDVLAELKNLISQLQHPFPNISRIKVLNIIKSIKGE